MTVVDFAALHVLPHIPYSRCRAKRKQRVVQ